MSRDEFLDRLFDRLAGTGGAGRRVLLEVEGHLDDAVEDAVAHGLTPTAAEARAIARMGTPDEIARAHALARQDLRLFWRPFLMGAWIVGVVVALAAGVSGLVCEALGRIGSPELVAGDRNGVTYTAARCAEYLALSPRAQSCSEAAAIDHWGEMVLGRVGLGALGVLGLAGLVLTRRVRLRGDAWRPPVPAAMLAATAMFAAAALVLGAPEVVNVFASSSTGTGAGLSDGAASLAFGAACGAWTVRRGAGRRFGRGSGGLRSTADVT